MKKDPRPAIAVPGLDSPVADEGTIIVGRDIAHAKLKSVNRRPAAVY